MNSALVFANAIALAVLVGFHFVPEDNEKVAGRMPHYLQVQKAPQWAVLNDQSFAPQAVSESEQALPAHSTERLVF
ncbi:hypothetical protein [Pseudomonas moraviensis]|uniref:Uncharacterized protein n=1 Tax=Pseudomonas moraviensis TaxID=321662 RepID=A0A7Z0AVQ9_9PSED|nr:hypothetical protein [Pseudomonas moraviensis]NYH10447.1 hypothetical protein [Pseudomonas moraviensis]